MEGSAPEIEASIATALTLHEVMPGHYSAPLEAGRWRLSVKVEADGRIWRMVGEVQ